MNLMELSARLSLDSSDYESGLSAAERGIGTLETALKAFVFGKVVKKFIGLAQDAVNTGMAFDSAMSQVAATMGVSVDQIANLRDFAKEMGATTKFSAVEAAQALNYMALAGYDAEKSMKTLPTVLNLAAAGGMDLARASDMVTDAESALGLTAEQTAAMVDQMARTASRSNTNVEQLGDAMLTIGGTAKFMAGGTDRLQTVLGLLADNGIKGSEAGTHLRNVLLKLSSPTEDGAAAMENLGVKIFDAGGNMRDMQNIMLDLNSALSSLTQEQRMQTLAELFNTRDLAAVNALLGTTEERWNELGATIAEASGSAHQMAGTQLGNLTGDITIMKSAMEGAKITLAEGINPALRTIVQRITKALSRPQTQKFLKDVGEKLGSLVKLLADKVSNAIPRVAKLFEDGGKKIKIFAGVISGLILTFKAVANPVGSLITALGLLTGAAALAGLTAEDTRKRFGGLTDAERDMQTAADEATKSFDEAGQARANSFETIDQETKDVQDLWAELQTLVDKNGKVKDGYEDRVAYINGQLTEAIGTEMQLNDGVLQGYQDQADAIDNLIRKRMAERKLAASEETYNAALNSLDEYQNSIEATEREIGNLEKALADAIAKNEELFHGKAITDVSSPLYARYKQMQDTIQGLRTNIETQKSKLQEYISAEQDAYHEIATYRNAEMELQKGNYAESVAILDNSIRDRWRYKAESGRITAEELKELKRQAQVALKASTRYREELLKGNEDYNRETLEKMEKNANDLIQIWGDAAHEAYLQGQAVGKNVGSGVDAGLEGMTQTVVNTARRLIGKAIQTMKTTAQIASPSKQGRAIGKNIGGSVGIGLDDSYDDVMQSSERLADGIFGNLNTSPTVGVSGAAGGSSGDGMDAVLGVLRDIRDNMGFDVVFPDGTLVARIDKLLGQTALRKVRGNA